MIAERTLELIHLVVDGEAGPEEQVELHNQASQSPEVQAAFEDLRQLSSDLESLSHPPIPPEIKPQILTALREKSRSTATPKVLPFSPRRKAFVALYAAAAVIVLAIALGPVILNQPSEPVSDIDAAGSMARIQTRSWPELQSVTSGDGQTTLQVRGNSNRLALEVSGAVQGPLSIAWDQPDFKVLASSPSSTRGSVSVTFPAGQQRAEVILQTGQSSGQPVNVFVSVGEEEILRTSVPLN